MRREYREELAETVLSMVHTTSAEVLVSSEHSALTRFTRDTIHQNVAKDETAVSLRIIQGGKMGVARTNRLDRDSLAACVAHASELSHFSPADPMLGALPLCPPSATPAGAFDEITASASPQRRANAVSTIFEHARGINAWCAGYVSTSHNGMTIANSSGVLQSFDGTDAAMNTKMVAQDSTGFAEAYSNSIVSLDAHTIGERAASIATRSAAPIAVDPGAWTVILEPAAFGELLTYLGDHFSAQAFDEGSSFFGRELGRDIFANTLSILDDCEHPLAPSMPFDYEGYQKSRVELVMNGRINDIVTDSYYARKLQRPNTGHALPAPNAYGPQPTNLVVAAGTKSRNDLIAATSRGLLISRFWYIRVVDRRRAIVTGMTRDGTFLIENGKIGHGVKNMRFNVSIIDALTHCEPAHEQRRTGGYAYSLVVPTARIDGFTFTSGTDF